MKKNIKNYWNGFTWGVEIEGGFSRELLDQFDDWSKKEDGSVSGSLFEQLHDGVRDINEITSPIYSNVGDLLKAVNKVMHSDGYAYDITCGVHLHMGPVSIESRQGRFWRGSYCTEQGKIEKIAKQVCGQAVADRLEGKNCTYATEPSCEEERTKIYFRGTKYTSIRNHPQGTIEMRFFAPCEELSEQIEQLLERVYTDVIVGGGYHRRKKLFTKKINI